MIDISETRKKLLGFSKVVVEPVTRPELFDFLGKTGQERAESLMQKVAPNTSGSRRKIFEYIVDFWQRSTLSVAYLAHSYCGANLAKNPFMAPSGKLPDDEFGFAEQYRWDTYFQNKGLILAGGHDLAIDQLINLADAFEQFKRIPNALNSAYLSHGQPPLEIFAVFDLLKKGAPKGEWLDKIIKAIEGDLFTEWLDAGSGKAHRQTKEFREKYGALTRYTDLHFHPLTAGLEDGKDHNWTSLTYGANYLPVQLNALIYAVLDNLTKYFEDPGLGNNLDRAGTYKELRDEFLRDFQRFFWVNEGKWAGFRNYSIVKGAEGSILYGDLSAEIFPLFCGAATPTQAEITKNNLDKYYRGDYGLSSTSLELRQGGSIDNHPEDISYQWEYPNCWPPLMYIAVEGLKRYGYVKEAIAYEIDWLRHIEDEFYTLSGFPEKSIYTSGVSLEKGLYGNVKGFGWTIGVYLSFLHDLAMEGFL